MTGKVCIPGFNRSTRRSKETKAGFRLSFFASSCYPSSSPALRFVRLRVHSAAPMIEVENLTRVFRTYKKKPGFWGGVKGLFHREFEETRAADNVSFSIAEGELVGFLGPNGAGKTTTLKMLSGLIYPTSGKARVAGFDPTKRENAYRRLF